MTVENVVKLLIRCGVLFKVRQKGVEILENIKTRSHQIKAFKKRVSQIESDLEDSQEEDELREYGDEIIQNGKHILSLIAELKKLSPICEIFVYKDNVRPYLTCS